MLVQSEVFTKIGKPYFALGYSPADDNYVGEDFFFCKKAREKGYQILIDQGLSKEVRHVGEMEYTHEHANVTREYVNSK
jgi:hypothetical protein